MTTPNTDALRCPFCNQQEAPFENLRDGEDDDEIVKCWTIIHACAAAKIHIICEGQTEQECVKAWNTRPPAPSVTSEDIEVAIGKPMGDLMAMDRQGGISYSPHALAQVATQAILTQFNVSKKEG